MTDNNNTAYLQNAEQSDGIPESTLQMDGGNDSIVTIPLSDSLRSTSRAVTLMAWTYRTKQHNVDVVGHGYPEMFFGFHGDKFKWLITDSANQRILCLPDQKLKAKVNHWFHIAGTYDGRTARLYVNGKEICRKSRWPRRDRKMSDGPFTISGYLDEHGNIIDEITGQIDDVRVYNRDLNAREIRQIYKESRRTRSLAESAP